MANPTRSRRPTIADGLISLAKALVLLAGVPFALARLWFLSPLPERLMSASGATSLATWSHGSVLVVGAVWVFASACLLREIAAAFRHGEAPGTTWSGRWAIAITALIVTATASPSLVPSKLANPRAVATILAPAGTDVSSRPPTDRARALAGECVAELAERIGACADDWPEIAALNFEALQPAGGRMIDPARLRGGWQLRTPSHSRLRNTAPVRTTTSDRGRPSELALIGLGVVTICALARRVRLLRRRDRALRKEGEFPPQAESDIAALETAIDPYAAAPILEWIDVANRLLALAATEEGAVDVRLVRAGPDGVEFLLSDALTSPRWPFRAERGGRWLRLDPLADLATLTAAARDLPRRYPALLPVGDDEAASYLVPLQPGRRLGITGDPELVDTALGAIVTALRVLPWAEACAVELVGMAPPDPDEQCRQLQSSGTAALFDLAGNAPRRVDSVDSPAAPKEPVLVLSRAAVSDTDAALVEKASKVAAVVAAGRGGSVVVHVDAEGAVLHPFAIAVSGVLPRPEQLGLVDSLLRSAARPPEIVSIPAPRALVDELESIPEAGVTECRVLGSKPAIIGRAQTPYRGDADRVVECLAFLALHEGHARVEAIAESLYARSRAELRRSRAENTLSALRACLGEPSSGQCLLFRRGDEVFLSEAVSCDWLRAKRAIAAAQRADPARATELLRSALELADGPSCAAVLSGFGWLRAEGIADEIEGTLVDAAHRLCSLALAGGDAALARWAVERGRRCVPESEMLGRDLMAVCEAEGDRRGVRAAFSELEAALERLGHNEPSAESRALLQAIEGD
jgi:DNA-binding SARP family transcriptional activator